MGLKSIYSKYFQKSKVFIYPLLGIKRGNSVIPIETYICWDGHYTSQDMRLICLYETNDSADYAKFERTILAKHTRLVDFVKNKNKSIFVFDFSDLEENWDHFLNGQYSKLNASTKNKILKFFDKNSGNYAYMYSYLMPEKHFETYADILGVNEDMLRKVGELCDKPDIDKETLVFEEADLDSLEEQINKPIKTRPTWRNK